MKKIILHLLSFVVFLCSLHAQKISELPAASSVDGSDTTVVVQGGVTKKTAVSLFPFLQSDGDGSGLTGITAAQAGAVPNDGGMIISDGAGGLTAANFSSGVGVFNGLFDGTGGSVAYAAQASAANASFQDFFTPFGYTISGTSGAFLQSDGDGSGLTGITRLFLMGGLGGGPCLYFDTSNMFWVSAILGNGGGGIAAYLPLAASDVFLGGDTATSLSCLFTGAGGNVAYATSAGNGVPTPSVSGALLQAYSDGNGGYYYAWCSPSSTSAYSAYFAQCAVYDNSGTNLLSSLFDGTGGDTYQATYAHALSPMCSGDGSYLTFSTVPANASDPGVVGQIAQDGTYLYLCTATNTWVRAPIATLFSTW